MPSTVTSTETMKALQALQAKKPSSPKALQTSMEPSKTRSPKVMGFQGLAEELGDPQGSSKFRGVYRSFAEGLGFVVQGSEGLPQP